MEKKFKPRHALTLGHAEIDQLRQLSHPNICRFIDGFVARSSTPGGLDEASLYMDLCDLGSLDGLIKRYKLQVPLPIVEESFVWHVFHGLLKALAYIHFGVTDECQKATPGWSMILHRDIKPANVFLQTSRRLYPTIILGDFGVACRQETDPTWGDPAQAHICGTPSWQPPEVPYHSIQGKGDVWAVGAVIMELCRLDGGPMGKRLPRGEREEDWELNPLARKPKPAGWLYSNALNECHLKSLALDRADRWSSSDLLIELKSQWQLSGVRYHAMPSWAFG